MSTNFFMDEEDPMKKNDGSFNSLLGSIVPDNGPLSNPMPAAAPAPKPMDMSKFLSSIPSSPAVSGSDVNVGPVQGPEVPPPFPAAPKRSIVDEYGDLAKSQDEAIKGTQDKVDTGNTIANILKALSGVANADTISRGGKGYDVSNFDRVVDANNARVAAAKAGKDSALGDLLKKYNLGNTVEDRVRGDKRFAQEEVDNSFKNNANKSSAESIDPSSSISKQAVLTGKAILMSKAKEATAAGDKQAADLLLNQAGQLEGLSAAKVNELINMNKNLDYKDVLNRNHQTAMAAASDKKQSQKDEKLKQQYTVGVRKEISGLPAFKDLQALDRQFSSMSEVFKNPNSVSDEAFIVNFQKMLDPGSVVREGEFARTREGSGLVAKLEMAIQQARGKGRVSPEVRKSILETSKAIADGAHNYFENTALAPYKEYMKAYDIPMEQVINTNARESGESMTAPSQPSGVQIKSVKDLPPI